MPRFRPHFVSLIASLTAAVVCAGWLGNHLCAQQPVQTNQTYEVLARGVVGSPPLQVQFTSAPLRLDLRNLIMGRGQTESIPVPTSILMELRQGGVTTTINQQQQERRQGDLWVVEQGSSLTMQNPGEVAVIRAIYTFEGHR